MQKERSEILYLTLRDEMTDIDIFDDKMSGNIVTFLKAKEHKGNKKKEKIKIKTKDLNFGSKKVLIIFGIIISILIIIQGIFYFLLSKKARQVTNMITLYANVVEHWVCFAEIYTIIFEVIVWNGDIKFWDRDPLLVYDEVKTRLEEVIIPGFEESPKWDLGNFTEKHRAQMTVIIYFLKYRIRCVKIF